MKAVLVLLVLALGAIAVRGEDAAVAVDADAATGNNNVAFVPQASEVDAEGETDMDADTAEEELLDGDFEADNDAGEEESESELEGDAEDESADVAEADEEADAEAAQEFEQEDENEEDTETEGEVDEAMSFAELDSETEGPMGKRRRGKKAKRRPLIAPRPLMRPVKFHSERITAQTSAREDPEMAKLNLALDAVKEDILSTNKQITDERKWVIAVAKIIASYNDKMKRVEAHIIALRKEMKALYRKKKQIENLKLQKALEAKLREARDELATLTNSLKHVAVKQGELNKSGADLRQTIAGIQSQLAKLRGQQLRKPRPAAKGKRRGRGRGRKGGKRCKKGMRFSRKAKRCVKAKRAGRR